MVGGGGAGVRNIAQIQLSPTAFSSSTIGGGGAGGTVYQAKNGTMDVIQLL